MTAARSVEKSEGMKLLSVLGSLALCAAGPSSGAASHASDKSSLPNHGSDSSVPGNRQKSKRTQFTRGRPNVDKMERMTKEQVEYAMGSSPKSNLNLTDQEKRKLSDSYSYYPTFDNSQYVDKWSQGYRMLGGYIDCDHNKNNQYGGGSGDHNDNKDNKDQQHRDLNNKNKNNNGYGCSRWLMWASYYNPNYAGNEYYEYFGNYASSTLDCHQSNTEWELIGVYREELYQWYEQISKHLWAIDEYDYVVALAGLAYMTDSDCAKVGNDAYGNAIYAGVEPLSRGEIQMQLYSDDYCITPLDSGATYSDYVGSSSMKLSSKDNGGNYYNLYDYWVDSQEYTLYNFNQVYEVFKSCTPCMDYPTYQDGYFIGDTGTDDDDLINQCWKFYSHDSYTCNGDCIALGSAQGTILKVTYNGFTFGSGTPVDMSGYYSTSEAVEASKVEVPYFQSQQFATLKANSFIGLASVLFFGTFLAFAVARGSARALEKEDKAHVLLDDYYHDPYDEKKKRRHRESSKSRGTRSRKSRSSSRVSRSTSRHRSGDEKSKSRARSRSRSASRHRSASRTASSSHSVGSEDTEARRQRRREKRRERERRAKYEAPDATSERRSSRRSKSRSGSSRRVRDDF